MPATAHYSNITSRSRGRRWRSYLPNLPSLPTNVKGQNMTNAKRTSREISIEHVTITSERPFAEVRAALEANVSKFGVGMLDALSSRDLSRVRTYETSGPKLSLFLQRDHGALLESTGHPLNAIQYEIGNPVTATKMTRYNLGAALYAPLRVALYENRQGQGVFEYDRPSSLFGQFGDERVTKVGIELDHLLEELLLGAVE